jgi:hypothetical protein
MQVQQSALQQRQKVRSDGAQEKGEDEWIERFESHIPSFF